MLDSQNSIFAAIAGLITVCLGGLAKWSFVTKQDCYRSKDDCKHGICSKIDGVKTSIDKLETAQLEILKHIGRVEQYMKDH
jgi:hypothetical protein